MKTTTRTKVSNIWNWLRGKPMTEPTAQQKLVFGENVTLDAAGNVIENGVGALKYRVKQVIAKAEADLVALFDEQQAAAKVPAPTPAPEATPVPAQVVLPAQVVHVAGVEPVADPKQVEKDALVAKLKALEAELATL